MHGNILTHIVRRVIKNEKREVTAAINKEVVSSITMQVHMPARAVFIFKYFHRMVYRKLHSQHNALNATFSLFNLIKNCSNSYARVINTTRVHSTCLSFIKQ